ncbi:MAG: hypothetical protein P8008_04710 [Gammaproteobacteria bacterium]
MRIVSWLVVIGSLVWIASSAWEPIMSALGLPPVQDSEVAGTAAPGEAESEQEASSSGDTAEVPYASIYAGLLMAERAAGLDRVDAQVIVRTSRQGLSPGDIELTIDDGAQINRFSVGPRGEVRIPARAEWRDSDLTVRSNQPADSLRFSSVLLIRELSGPRLRYASLWEIREQVQQAMDAMRPAGTGEQEVLGLALRYAPGAPATVRVLSDRYGEEYAADPRGVIRMPLKEVLREDNPEVVFDPLPAQILPLLR